MINNIKKRLIHFYTSGNITEDFVAHRRKKTKELRRLIHICFYAQCALAVLSVIFAAVLGAGAGIVAVIIGAVAAIAMALFALGGGYMEKTILYLLNLVYSVICFIVGAATENGSPFTACGVIMLIAAVFALTGYFASYFREYLMDFSPLAITRSDYTRLANFSDPEPVAPKEPPIPPAPPKSELKLLSEQLKGILTAPPVVQEQPPAQEEPVTTEQESNVPTEQAEPVQQTSEQENTPAETPTEQA